MNKNKWCLENCEVIERLNNTIDTLSKELEVYKKALALACESLEKMCDVTKNCDEVNCPIYEDCQEQFGGFDIYFFNKAKENSNE